jgi:hypothetical protein
MFPDVIASFAPSHRFDRHPPHLWEGAPARDCGVMFADVIASFAELVN